MLIPRRAVEQYLTKERGDFRPMKLLRPHQVEEQVRALPVKPPLWDILKHHQKVMFLLGAREKTLAVLSDTGTGKTVLSIALARYFKEAGYAQRSLILVPRRVNKGEWAREIEKHSPTTSYLILQGSSRDKWEALLSDNAMLVIETYAGLARMACDKSTNSRGKVKLRPDPKLVKALSEQFQAFYCDESTMVKSHKSLPFRICRHLMKTCPIRFALTGTPFGRDPTDLWAQFYLMDGGETLGPTLGLYRAAFFNEKKNYWGGFEYTFIKKKQELLNRFIAGRSIRYEADQADLPSVSMIKKYISLPEETRGYYQKLRDAIRKAKGNVVEIRETFLRMRQVSSGFVGYKDDDTGERAEFEFDYNPKLDMLLSVIESIREDCKIVVFLDFIHSGTVISRELAKLKIKHLHVYGGTKDPAGAIKDFNTDPSYRVLVLNNSMVLGLNIQVAQYAIYFESPVSVIMRKQADRRVIRQYSEHSRVFIYDLIVRNTADERILEFHREGKDLFKAIVDGEVEL